MRQQALCNSIYTWTQDKHQHTQWSERSLQSTTGQQQPLQGFNNRRHHQLAPTTMEDRPQWTVQQRTKEKVEEAQETKHTKESNKAEDTKEKEKDMATTMATAKKGKDKRKTSVATSERNRQRTRKEQRSQQPRKRKEPNGSMLQMWPTRSLGQRLQDSSLQLVGHNIWATTRQHGTLVSPKQWLRCQLVQQRPNMLLPGQWATIPAAPTNTTTCADSTKTHSSAGTTNAGNTSCGRTGQQDVNNTNPINTSVSPKGWS